MRESVRSGLLRVLLWDFERGSLAYDILVLLMLAVLFLVPDAAWNDPLRGRR